MQLETTDEESAIIEPILGAYEAGYNTLEIFGGQVRLPIEGSRKLAPYIHSTKSRMKDPDHLRGKLVRKLRQCHEEGTQFEVDPENVFVKVNDLFGMRLLHLYTRQFERINGILSEIFDEHKFELVEEPFARTWDDEYREYFESCGIATQESPTLYTSVHYVISSNSRTPMTCEIQVRTLMEEVWGEVDHALNYPTATEILASKEQLKVLARVTSSATRLVDSLFLTHQDATGGEP